MAKWKEKNSLNTKRLFWFNLRSLHLNNKFMKIRPVRTELLHADGRTVRYDEANSRCSQANSRYSRFCERAQKFSLYRAVNTPPLHHRNSLLTVVTEIIVLGSIIIRSMWQPLCAVKRVRQNSIKHTYKLNETQIPFFSHATWFGHNGTAGGCTQLQKYLPPHFVLYIFIFYTKVRWRAIMAETWSILKNKVLFFCFKFQLGLTVFCCRLRLKCDGTRAETIFRLSGKRTSPFKLAGGVSSVDYWQPRCAHQR